MIDGKVTYRGKYIQSLNQTLYIIVSRINTYTKVRKMIFKNSPIRTDSPKGLDEDDQENHDVPLEDQSSRQMIHRETSISNSTILIPFKNTIKNN